MAKFPTVASLKTVDKFRDRLRELNLSIDAEDEILAGESSPLAKGIETCLLYTSPSPRDKRQSRMPSSA